MHDAATCSMAAALWRAMIPSQHFPSSRTGAQQARWTPAALLRRAVKAVRDRPMPLALAITLALFAGALLSMNVLHAQARRVMEQSLNESLASSARVAAAALNAGLHASIRAREQDGSPEYQQAVAPLQGILRAVPSLRYIYTFREHQGQVTFVLDATPPGDHDGDGVDDHAHVGQVYETPDEAMLLALATQRMTATLEPATDQWGTFMSAYAPVRDAHGDVECFVGVDMNVEVYQARLAAMDSAARAGVNTAAAGSVLLGILIYMLKRSSVESRKAAMASAALMERTASFFPGALYTCVQRPDGKVSIPYASPGLRDLFGLDPAAVRHDASQMQARIHPDDLPGMMQAATIARRDSTLWSAEFRVRHEGGRTRWVEGRCMPHPEPDGGVQWYGYFADITERKGITLALEQAKLDAEEANRAKGEFVANISHEIRTPISAILGYAELLHHGEVDSSTITHEEAADAIHRNATHLLALVNDILDVAKLESGKLVVQRVPTDVRQLAGEVLDMLRVRATERGIAMHLSCDPAVPERMLADPLRVRQIITNLVGNAIKFTEEGSIWLRIQVEEGPTVALTVRDTGIGMTETQLGKIFRPFTQVDSSMSRSFGGAGLGLAISRELAERMGGTLTACSRLGAGSEFTLRLPVQASATPQRHRTPPAPAQPAEAEDPLPLLGCRVLLAEDGPDNARLITHHLTAAGAVVDLASDGSTAVDLVRTSLRAAGTPYDLILMDMQMPRMDGYTATEHLRSMGVRSPVVALTAHATEDDRARCLAVGCDDYAAKPIPRASLISMCGRWTGRWLPDPAGTHHGK